MLALKTSVVFELEEFASAGPMPQYYLGILPAMPRAEISVFLCLRTQRRWKGPGMFAPMQTEATMRSYFKAVGIIMGLLGTYIALLPLVA
jgi:hypothetical protein